MYKKTNFTSGFTLIELMTVISIISLLSTVVLRSVNAAREQARMSSIIQFDTNLKHIIGDQLVGEWLFNNPANPTFDSSSFNSVATIVGAPTYKTSGNYNSFGKGYYDFPRSGGLRITTLNPALNLNGTTKLTQSAWINPRSVGNGWRTIIGRGANPQGTLWLDNYQVGFRLQLSTGFVNFVSTVGVSLNKWTHVAATYDGTNMKIYIDGKLVSTRPTTGTIQGSIQLALGMDPDGGNPFEGGIDDIRIYTASLTAMEIENIYAESLNKYQDLAINN